MVELSYTQQLANLADGLAEDVFEMSPVDVRAELAEWGNDAPGRVRQLLRDAVARYKRKHRMREDTELKDKDGRSIREGDLLRVGMRVGDPAGWSIEQVAWNPAANKWGLLDPCWPEKREFEQMQWNARLREVLGSVYDARDEGIQERTKSG